VVLLNECSELGARKMLEQLIEQARNLYDCLALLVGDVWRGFWQETARQRPNYRRALHLFQSPACCFGQEWFSGKQLKVRVRSNSCSEPFLLVAAALSFIRH